jgi:hypothetical protein
MQLISKGYAFMNTKNTKKPNTPPTKDKNKQNKLNDALRNNLRRRKKPIKPKK